MSLTFLLPGLAAILLGIARGHVRWRMQPAIAVWLLATLAGVSAATAVLVVAATAAGFLATQFSVVSSLLAWFPTVPVHHRVGFAMGVPSLIAVGVAMIRAQSVLRLRRWAMGEADGRRLSVLETDEPIAFAAPGSPGCVVVSRGLLSALSPMERQVVFAHERAHLDQRHDRFLLVGALAEAVLPLLRPVADQLRLATERCADEAAVCVLDGDRDLVATAIARAALATSAYHRVAGSFGGGSIPVRVDCLIGSPRRPASLAATAILTAVTVLVMVGASSMQLHHLLELMGHL